MFFFLLVSVSLISAVIDNSTLSCGANYAGGANGHGLLFTPNKDITISNVVVSGIGTPPNTMCFISTDGTTPLASATLSGTNCPISFNAVYGTTYAIQVNANGSTAQVYYCSGVTYPKNGINLNFTNGMNYGSMSPITNAGYNVVSITSTETPSTTYTVKGTVTDNSVAVEGAEVELKHLATNTSYYLATNSSGRFIKADLTNAGMYMVTAWLYSNFSLQPITHYVNVSVAN